MAAAVAGGGKDPRDNEEHSRGSVFNNVLSHSSDLSFICWLDSVAAAVAGGGEDPLDNEEQLADQLDSIPFLCRFQYARTAEYLLQFLDPLVAAYTDAATPGALGLQLFEDLQTCASDVV